MGHCSPSTPLSPSEVRAPLAVDPSSGPKVDTPEPFPSRTLLTKTSVMIPLIPLLLHLEFIFPLTYIIVCDERDTIKIEKGTYVLRHNHKIMVKQT